METQLSSWMRQDGIVAEYWTSFGRDSVKGKWHLNGLCSRIVP
jgi:hypothetical protein